MLSDDDEDELHRVRKCQCRNERNKQKEAKDLLRAYLEFAHAVIAEV